MRPVSMNDHDTPEFLASVVSGFSLPGVFAGAEPFGSGLINDTYLGRSNDHGQKRLYVFQRLNTSVFKYPEQVMENVELVTNHIAARLRSEGAADPASRTPMLVRTRSGGSFLRDPSGAYWRAFHYIDSGAVFDIVRDAQHAYEVGRGLGRFQALVADLRPGDLHDTLPGFHRTPGYLDEFDGALKADSRKRAIGIGPELDFVSHRRSLAFLLTDHLDAGDIPLRVVHNDPKVNNIMVHKESGKALCMLDLDTVKPGIVQFDFGDCVRSAAYPAGEDARDLDTVKIELGLFEAIAKGYVHEANVFLTDRERMLLPLSVKVITFELGLRFFADHMRGDTYFRIKYPGHNLHRARVQFRLLESIEAAEERMTSLIAGLPATR